MVKQYKVETPEQLLVLHGIKPEGDNMSMRMLSTVWRAERSRREKAGRIDLGPIVRVVASFETGPRGSRKCEIIKINRVSDIIGRLPYSKALAYCRENLKQEG